MMQNSGIYPCGPEISHSEYHRNNQLSKTPYHLHVLEEAKWET